MKQNADTTFQQDIGSIKSRILDAEPALLIRRADEAMYRAKRLGSGSYSF